MRLFQKNSLKRCLGHGPRNFIQNLSWGLEEGSCGIAGFQYWNATIPVVENVQASGGKDCPGIGGILFLAGESNGQFRDQPPPKYPQRTLFGRKSPEKCNPRTSALLNFEPGPKRNKTETGFNLRGNRFQLKGNNRIL